MALADAGWAEDVFFAFGELAGGEEVDLVLVEASLEGEVEFVDGLAEGEAAALECGLDSSLFARVPLDVQQVLEGLLQAVVLAGAGLEQFGEAFGHELEAEAGEERAAAIEAGAVHARPLVW